MRYLLIVLGLILAQLSCVEDSTTTADAGPDATQHDEDRCVPGKPCGACGEISCVDDQPVCDDEPRNRCGGCGELPGEIGGACERGTWVCNDVGGMYCDQSDPRNPCGGDQALAHRPGDPCGECGVYMCNRDGTIRCEDRAANACGGCSELGRQPHESCGACGTYVCQGQELVACDDPGRNECGGCAILTDDRGAEVRPGEQCGQCGSRRRCAGGDAVVCRVETSWDICADFQDPVAAGQFIADQLLRCTECIDAGPRDSWAREIDTFRRSINDHSACWSTNFRYMCRAHPDVLDGCSDQAKLCGFGEACGDDSKREGCFWTVRELASQCQDDDPLPDDHDDQRYSCIPFDEGAWTIVFFLIAALVGRMKFIDSSV